jgi:cation transport regulator
MPITKDQAPDTLPSHAKDIYVAAWNSAYKNACADQENKDECAAKIAWGAVKQKYTKEGDTWVPKADTDDSFVQFSMYIDKAVYNKEEQEFRWHCVASDVDEDIYKDNMTLELFSKFLARIESGEMPPEKYRSEFWSGGMPYISLSHYSDQNGNAVPGTVESVYVDGKKLKSKGTFHKTPLGMACFDAINRDKVKKSDVSQNPVRISIAFLDYAHRHKSNGQVFIRESTEDVCPWCILEAITGTGSGKEYLDGHLIHEALTRVPVNQRTSMEVEMAITRKDDAESIVGELAEEIDKEEINFRSDVLVTMSESDLVVENAKTKKDEEDAEPEEEDMDEEKKKKVAKKEEKADHVLESSFTSFRAAFDQVVNIEASSEEKLRAMQPFMEDLANVVRSNIESVSTVKVDPAHRELEEFRSQVSAQFSEINKTLQLLLQLQENKSVVQNSAVPVPRSIQPPMTMVPQVSPAQQTLGPRPLREIIERGMGLRS